MIKYEFTKLYQYLERRFDKIDRRFEQVDQRFEKLEGTLVDFGVQLTDQRQELEFFNHQVDRRFQAIESKLR